MAANGRFKKLINSIAPLPAIEKIVLETANDGGLLIMISLMLQEKIGRKGKGSWITGKYAKYLKLKIVQSIDAEYSSKLMREANLSILNLIGKNDGNLSELSPNRIRDLIQDLPEQSKKQALLFIDDDMMVRSINPSQEVMGGVGIQDVGLKFGNYSNTINSRGVRIFQIPIDISFPIKRKSDDLKYLSYHIIPYLDTEAISEEFGMTLEALPVPMYGKMITARVLENSSIIGKTTINEPMTGVTSAAA